MRYESPAVEARLDLSVQLGEVVPSGGLPQPVWRPAKPGKPRQR